MSKESQGCSENTKALVAFLAEYVAQDHITCAFCLFLTPSPWDDGYDGYDGYDG
jgi:hypothetical protein